MPKPKKKKKIIPLIKEKHLWRVCPLGQFYRRGTDVREYIKKGYIVHEHPRDGGCVVNRSGKDQIYPEEMQEIADQHFAKLSGPPTANQLGFQNGNKYDDIIRGWTKYWNEVLNPKEPLDPNLVKALIASESSFRPAPKPQKVGYRDYARGIIQLTDGSRKILANEQGEIRDHYVNLTAKEAEDPTLAICGGVRWLFRKMAIAYSRKKSATWRDAVLLYKNFPSSHPKMKIFDDFYKKLKN